ncbi:MAG TPA: hypothetical protein VLQ68_04010, partial [Rhizobiaceae bacterium]|nr:hypothetical protein [Rhizobiaceae bacterium]
MPARNVAAAAIKEMQNRFLEFLADKRLAPFTRTQKLKGRPSQHWSGASALTRTGGLLNNRTGIKF